MTATSQRDRLDVLLMRDVPEQRLLSMERLADETERGFASHPGVAMRSMAVDAWGLGGNATLRRADGYAARFVRYPLAARRARAGVYHIIDHGYAHLAAMLPPARTVISCHDLMLMKAEQGEAGFRPGRVALARFKWSTSFLRRAAKVIAPTEATKRDLIALRGVAPERISVVPYGVDARFRPLSAERRAAVRASLASNQHMLLSVSTGDPYKNVPATLRVTAALRRAGVDVVLARAGRPLDAAQRALAASLGIAGAVVDLGRVSETRLAELYAAADVLLFPSFYEGYGWPPLEAMASGTPVVASDCAAIAEVCGDAALLAGARDIEGLTRATLTVLASPDLAARIRGRGMAHVAQFTWERTIDGFAAAYVAVAEADAIAVTERRRACAA